MFLQKYYTCQCCARKLNSLSAVVTTTWFSSSVGDSGMFCMFYVRSEVDSCSKYLLAQTIFLCFALVSLNSTSKIGFEDHEYFNRTVKYTVKCTFPKIIFSKGSTSCSYTIQRSALRFTFKTTFFIVICNFWKNQNAGPSPSACFGKKSGAQHCINLHMLLCFGFFQLLRSTVTKTTYMIYLCSARHIFLHIGICHLK